MFIFVLVTLFKTIIIIGHGIYVMYAIYFMCSIIVFDRPISKRVINTKNSLINGMIFGFSYSNSRNSLNVMVTTSLNCCSNFSYLLCGCEYLLYYYFNSI